MHHSPSLSATSGYSVKANQPVTLVFVSCPSQATAAFLYRRTRDEIPRPENISLLHVELSSSSSPITFWHMCEDPDTKSFFALFFGTSDTQLVGNMPNRHSKHEGDPYGSNLEILDASPASNNDDGDDESRQRQTVRQPGLGYASPRETADRLSDTEDSESLQLAMEMSGGLDEDSKGPRRKIPKTSTLGEAEPSVLWQNEEVFEMARKMVRAGLSMENVVEMWEAAIDPVDLVREMKEKEALKAEADRGGAQGQFSWAGFCVTGG